MKIIIIAQHILPIQTPRAHRATELAKELARQGNEVVLYAVLGKYDYSDFEKENKLVVKNIPLRTQVIPYNSDGNGRRHFIDKVLGKLFGKLLEFPNIEFKYAIPKIIAKEESFDLVVSIAKPHAIHWGCSRAKKKYPQKFPKKWIADCGDPFMNNGKSKDHFEYYSKNERLFSELCDYITVPVSGAIDGYYPEYRDKIKVIPQGFKFEIKNDSPPSNKILSFAYSGTFLRDIRNPHKFLAFIAELDVDFRFYVFTQFDELIAPFKEVLGEKLIIKKLVPRDELLAFLSGMDFLVNIENLNSSTQVPSKLIDYAIVGRPILSIHPENIDKQNIKNFFEKNYSGKFVVENIEQYQIKNVANKFIELAK